MIPDGFVSEGVACTPDAASASRLRRAPPLVDCEHALIITATEANLNPAYISAFAALAGAVIGGLTSFATAWFTEQSQLRAADRQARRAKLESLYNDYITEAVRQYGDALTHQTEDPTIMLPLYALGSRMRLVAARRVIDAAARMDEAILQTYLGPNRSLLEMKELARKGEMNILLTEFSEACRDDLAVRSQ